MNKLLIAILACVILSACGSQKSALTAPEGMSRELKAAGLNVDPLSEKQSAKWLGALAKSYPAWEKMQISGSLSIRQLPLNPSVRIYMERGSLVILSLRVPLLGEVGRAEIAPDSTLVVNRRDKSFTKLSTARLLSRIGVDISDFQDLLLGRVFLAGGGSLSAGNADLFTVSEAAGGNYIVAPRKQRDDAEYGFTIYPDGKMLMAVAFTTDETYLLQSQYSYLKNGGTSLDFQIAVDKKTYNATLSLDAPDYNPKPLERTAINRSWKRVELKKLVTSF